MVQSTIPVVFIHLYPSPMMMTTKLSAWSKSGSARKKSGVRLSV
jgi:hypothetical protein